MEHNGKNNSFRDISPKKLNLSMHTIKFFLLQGSKLHYLEFFHAMFFLEKFIASLNNAFRAPNIINRIITKASTQTTLLVDSAPMIQARGHPMTFMPTERTKIVMKEITDHGHDVIKFENIIHLKHFFHSNIVSLMFKKSILFFSQS